MMWNWKGNLRDDCTAVGHGLMLRAEMMDKGNWWWAVSRGEDGFGEQVKACYDCVPSYAKTGKEARASAESVANDIVAKQ